MAGASRSCDDLLGTPSEKSAAAVSRMQGMGRRCSSLSTDCCGDILSRMTCMWRDTCTLSAKDCCGDILSRMTCMWRDIYSSVLRKMEKRPLLSAFYFFSMQVVFVLIMFNIKGAFSPPTCPLSSPPLASHGGTQASSVWYYEHVFDHKPARLRILTEKEGAGPLISKIPSKKREITIVSGTTRDRLAAVESTTMVWNGALSLAVHVLGEADIPSVYRQVQRMHARVEAKGVCRLDIVLVKEDGPEGFTRHLYPVNGMRNMAWRMATTKLVLLLDADFKPSPRMHEILTEDEGAYQELERKATKERHLFVVPAFEFMPSNRPRLLNVSFTNSQLNSSIPETKEDLKKRWQAGVVDCFHCSFSPAGHEPTNFRKFFDSAITTPYEISYMEGFEPYLLVGRESTPKYDERFRGYGKNKISHVHSCAKGNGMHFQVLPNTFVFEIPHPQSHSRKHWGHAKTSQNVNRITGLYRRFRKEVKQMQEQRIALEADKRYSSTERM